MNKTIIKIKCSRDSQDPHIKMFHKKQMTILKYLRINMTISLYIL